MHFYTTENIPKIPELEDDTTSAGRFYFTPEGKKYPSITTVLGAQSKEGINEWRDKMGHEAADKYTRLRASYGSKMHKMCENYLCGDIDSIDKKEYVPYDLFKSIKPVIDESVTNVWYQEQTLYSDLLKTAGRVDVIAEWNGTLSIIDFKSSAKIKRKDWITNYFVQEAFYALALEERIGTPVKQIVTLIAVDDNEPQVFIEKTEDYIQTLIEARTFYSNRFK